MPKRLPMYIAKPLKLPRALWRLFKKYWRKNWLHKIIVVLVVLAGLSFATMYGIARWYIWQQSSKPLTMGASFIPDYARGFGLDPKQTLDAMLHDLGIKHLRLVSYWSTVEPTKGTYNFSELDWEFQKANAAHAKISLSVGLRQPRWPECHPPSWVDTTKPYQQWYPDLEKYMTAVVDRYKNNPALESYQLENEYFLKAFGECKNYSRDRLVQELQLVKKLDPHHTVIIARSNNNLGLPIGKPTPDEFGVSVYKRVWVPAVGRYIEYPFPAWYYAFFAGAGELLTGKNMVVHELQAEPWPPHGQSLLTTSIEEQNNSLSATRLKGRFTYAQATGIRNIDLWGAEFWYYRKEKLHEPSLWNTAKAEFQSVRDHGTTMK